MIDEFKKFLLRGNVLDLAVGVVIGAAFGTVVNALVWDLLTPLIAAMIKVPDFTGLVFTLNGSNFLIGHFLNAFISFLLVAGAVFFFVVKPVNLLMEKAEKLKEMRKEMEEEAIPKTKKCLDCLSDIPVEAKRCAHCTQRV